MRAGPDFVLLVKRFNREINLAFVDGGYGGNGVMYSAQAGRRMAQMVAGKGQRLDLPIFTSSLPSHGILTPFRRLGQRFMYVWYYVNDEMF